MEKLTMETNKWLWQPDKNGPIFLRLSYRDAEGKKKQFVCSLNTNHLPTARSIRDTEFTPIVHSMEKAKAQMELAARLYPQLEEQLRKGVHGAFQEKPKLVTLDTVIKAWKEALSSKGGNYETARRTASRYSAIADRFAARAGGSRGIDTFNSQDIIKYRDTRLEEDLTSKKTLDLELGAFKGLFKFAVEKYKISVNPALGITVNRTRSEKNREGRIKKRRPPTRDEADTICTKFPAHRAISSAEFQDFAMFARYTGMRQNEIGHLKKEDFRYYKGDLYADVVIASPLGQGKECSGKRPEGHILCLIVKDEENRETKTGLERLVPISDKLLPVVKKKLASSKKDYLFPGAAKDDCRTFGRTFLKKLKTIAGDLTMHGFRHYAASEMENKGVGSSICGAILGHAASDVHSGYLHITVAAMKEAVDKIY